MEQERTLTETYITDSGYLRLKLPEYKKLDAKRRDIFYLNIDERGIVITKTLPIKYLFKITKTCGCSMQIDDSICKQYLYLEENHFIKRIHRTYVTEKQLVKKFVPLDYHRVYYYIENQELIIPIAQSLKEAQSI